MNIYEPETDTRQIIIDRRKEKGCIIQAEYAADAALNIRQN